MNSGSCSQMSSSWKWPIECQCISHERNNWGQYCVYFCYWRRDHHFTRSSEPLEGSTFLSRSVCPVPGIEPSTSLSSALPAELVLPWKFTLILNILNLFLFQSNVPWNHLVPVLICNQNAGGWLWCGAAKGGVQGMPAAIRVLCYCLFVCLFAFNLFCLLFLIFVTILMKLTFHPPPKKQ